jgi:alcohol dehydrogenase class IV
MNTFSYTSHSQRVLFGAGSLQYLAHEIEALGAQRALVISTPAQRSDAEKISGLLGKRAAGIFDEAVMHVPIETARAARDIAKELGADCAIAIGGGSTIGLGKAIALDSGLPILAIPTTYAGSEMTTIYGLTEGGLKRTGRDPRVLPRTVIYDPELTHTLPVEVSIASGLNAIAHAAEGLYAQDGNPIASLMAEQGIAALGRALPLLYGRREADQAQARTEALYGAWLCGTVLGSVGVALHHKLCHTLGGTFNLPHAETHSIVLPHALAYNAEAAPDAMKRIAAALGYGPNAQLAARAVFDLAKVNGLPVALRDIGMKETGLDKACDTALENEYPNPRPLERDAIRSLLQNAFEGNRPD